METPPRIDVPVWVRAEFAHAVVQHLAARIGADVLHLKGSAADLDLRSRPEGGGDADVLVRPAHLETLLAAMWHEGWTRYSSFESGSAFEHATTAQHPLFLFADVHRFNPGFDVDPARAFDVLWQTRQERDIAGMPCAVPDRAGQVLVHILNQTRSRKRRWSPAEVSTLLGEVDLSAFESLVHDLDASVGYAAAIGELEQHRGARTYALWRSTVEGGSRIQEWVARIRAARGLRSKARLIWRAPLVNVDHLTHRLGHQPTRSELAREFVARPTRGAQQEWRRMRSWLSDRRGGGAS